jgi:hypothetical protein
MAVVLRGHLLLAPASIAAPAVATVLGLVLVGLTHQTARARALRTLVFGLYLSPPSPKASRVINLTSFSHTCH